ncbi:hypothetical protein Tco_1082771 [Tanacetum coccineum]|uniref:Gag-Pol polyprotein n=1 Tax=Tanacetum coccineum TaxID=301880 RepID=A0ABQ5I2J2_9ASTR
MFMLKKTTMIKQRMHHFDKMNLSILSVHRYKTLLSLPHVCDNENMHSIQPTGVMNTNGPPKDQLRTMSTEEPKNNKEAMADSAWIEAMQDELH